MIAFFPTDKIRGFIQFDEKTKTGFIRIRIDVHFGAPSAESLLQPHRVHGVGAKVLDAAEFGAGFFEREVDLRRVAETGANFPAEFAGIRDASGGAWNAADLSFLVLHEGPAFVRNVFERHQFGKYIARSRASQSENGDLVGDVLDGNLPFARVRLQPAEIVTFGTRAGEDEEFGVVDVGDGQFSEHFSLTE